MKQLYNNIPVFGRSVKIHYNKTNLPSSMSDSYHIGEFENSIPSIDISYAKQIVSTDFQLADFSYKNIYTII